MTEPLLARARALVIPALLLVGLEWYARTLGANSDTLAPPSAAAKAFARALADGSLFAATGFTLQAAALGLGLGALLGVGLGIVLGLSPRAAAVGFLSIEFLRPVPSVALIPIAMLVFGFGLRMEISVVAFATFWPPRNTVVVSSSRVLFCQHLPLWPGSHQQLSSFFSLPQVLVLRHLVMTSPLNTGR